MHIMRRLPRPSSLAPGQILSNCYWHFWVFCHSRGLLNFNVQCCEDMCYMQEPVILQGLRFEHRMRCTRCTRAPPCTWQAYLLSIEFLCMHSTFPSCKVGWGLRENPIVLAQIRHFAPWQVLPVVHTSHHKYLAFWKNQGVILGAQWGDEGKGKLVDILAQVGGLQVWSFVMRIFRFFESWKWNWHFFS